MKFGLQKPSLRKRIAEIIFFYLTLLPIAVARPEISPGKDPIGRTAILRHTMIQTVELSAKPDAWDDVDILVRVPNGTAAEIIDQRRLSLTGDQELTIYQVKVAYQGKEYTGWVRGTYVQVKPNIQPAAPVIVEEVDAQPCIPLLEKYGPSPIASVIRTIRKGSLTIEVNSQLREATSSPNLSLITPRSVCRDLAVSGISLTEFTERAKAQRVIEEQAAIKRAEEERREREREREREQARREEAQRQAEAERARVAALESAPGCKDEAMARVMAKEFVTRSLKAPATAQFPWFSQDQYRYLGSCRHQIASYVDSQNGFGALLRSYYIVVVRFAGGDRWTVDEIHFSKP